MVEDDECGYAWLDPEKNPGIPGVVSPAEAKMCALGGDIAIVICTRAGMLPREATEYAREWFTQRGGPDAGYLGGPPHGSRGNAVKHMLWNALMAQDFGDGYAELLADAHELLDTYDAAVEDAMDRQMDFANNWYGREIGDRTAGTISDDVAFFVERGLGCSRVRTGPNEYKGPFVNLGRCGLG